MQKVFCCSFFLVPKKFCICVGCEDFLNIKAIIMSRYFFFGVNTVVCNANVFVCFREAYRVSSARLVCGPRYAAAAGGDR